MLSELAAMAPTAIAMSVRSRITTGRLDVNDPVGSPGSNPPMVTAAAPAAMRTVHDTKSPMPAAQPAVRRDALAGRYRV